jgi:hypothetical protein
MIFFLVPLCLHLVQKYEKNAVANDKCVFATCTEFNDLRQLMFDECCEFSC